MRRIHYILIAVAVLSIFIIIFSFNKSETTGNVVDECNAPSVLIDEVCCLDSDADEVCDAPEEVVLEETPTPVEALETEYSSFKAKLYLSGDILASETALPQDSEKISQFVLDKTVLSGGKEYYGKYYLYTYLDQVYNEDVMCNIEEYYGAVLSDKFSAEILAGQKTHLTEFIGYEVQGTPDRVRYDMTCVGFNSRIEWKDSYAYDLVVKN